VAKKPLVDANIFTESELGKNGSALFFTYAIGKLVNSFFSDRTNINRFISAGLLLTALVNLAMGIFPYFYVFIILWGFWGAGVAGILGAIMVFIFLHDSPESKGLPPVEVLKSNDGDKQKADQPVAVAQR
jgi:sugar phosphate permease